MSFTARSIYRELLDVQWENGRLTSVERLLNIIGVSAEQWSEFAPYLDELFPNGVNPKMDELRNDAISRQEQKRIAGEKSAEKRRSQIQNNQQQSNSSTSVERALNECSTKHKNKHLVSSNEDIKGKAKSFGSDQAIEVAKSAGIEDHVLLSAMEEFVLHRREIKHPLTERAWSKIVEKLKSVSVNVAIESINRSISSGWRDVFPEVAIKGAERPSPARIKAGAINWLNEREERQRGQMRQAEDEMRILGVVADE
jgi:hypothetical protein